MPKVSEEHRAARREQIVDAMLRCVAREGFHRTTMAAVIAESGLSAGAVYLYFRSKRDLIQALAERVVADGLGVVVEQGAQVPPPHRVLEGVLTRLTALGAEHGVELYRVALQTWAEAARDPDVAAIYRREGLLGLQAWRRYVEQAVDAGHLPPSADPVSVGHVLIGLIPGYLVQQLIFDDLTPAAYAAGVAQLAPGVLTGGRAAGEPAP